MVPVEEKLLSPTKSMSGTSDPRVTIPKPTSTKEWTISSSLRAAGLVV